jgi:hypothetical protein
MALCTRTAQECRLAGLRGIIQGLVPGALVNRLDFRVEKQLKRLVNRQPELCLRTAASLGALSRAPRWTPTREEVGGAFRVGDARSIARIRRRVGGRELRNTLFRTLVNRRSVAGVADRVVVRGGEQLLRLCANGTPPVIVFGHMGVPLAIEAGLAQLGLRALVAAMHPPRRTNGGVRFQKVGEWTEGARFLLLALRELRAGGLPVLSLDAVDRGSGWGTLFGKRVPISRGPAVLAWMAGALLVPMSARWLGSSGRVEVWVHDAFPKPAEGASREAFEAALMSEGSRWLEAHLSRHPWELRLDRLRVYAARAPLETDGGAVAAGPQDFPC